MDPDRLRAALRWRLVLGRHADAPLPMSDVGGAGRDGAAARDRVLSALYDREHERRGHRRAGGGDGGGGIVVPEWLAGVRALFPREAVEVVERDALVRYGLVELVTDPEVLRTLAPTLDLVKAILQLKDRMSPEVKREARRVVREVVEKLAERLRRECEPALYGPADPERSRPARTFRNTDWHGTIRRNLEHWDAERARLVPDRIVFRNRQRGRNAWRIVLAVDQSGSMLDSVIHASVVGAILASMPAVSVHLVLWDHRVVDLTAHVHDPLDVLMAAQLGGGTKLYPALRYCADLVTEPERTVVAVLSDFFVYDDLEPSLEVCRELVAAGVKGLGLCALDPEARPVYDERVARALADTGFWVGAVTPKALAGHLGRLLR